MGLLSGSTVLKWIDENNAAGHAFSVPVAVLTFATSRPLSATAPPVAPTIEDEVRGYLSRIPLFRVVSGDGTRHLETDSPNRNVWAKAGLRYAIAGSEHEAGGNLQLSVALIDMSSQLQIWSERFDYALSEWPLRQVEVARRIAYAVHVNRSAVRERHSTIKLSIFRSPNFLPRAGPPLWGGACSGSAQPKGYSAKSCVVIRNPRRPWLGSPVPRSWLRRTSRAIAFAKWPTLKRYCARPLSRSQMTSLPIFIWECCTT